MTEPVMIAMVSALGLILSGVLVEMVRTRRSTARTEAAVSTPGDRDLGALGTTLRQVAEDVAVIRAEQHQHHTRVAVVERLVEDHLRLPHVMNGRR